MTQIIPSISLRDIRSIGNSSRQISQIIIREEAIIVFIEFVRLIIQPKKIYVFNASHIAVERMVEQLSEVLSTVDTKKTYENIVLDVALQVKKKS